MAYGPRWPHALGHGQRPGHVPGRGLHRVPRGATRARSLALYPARGDLDECQIDASGQWLLVKSNVDATAGEDNLIVHVEDEESRILLDQQGAAGHSDNGHGYMVAADNWHNQPNALRLWMFDKGLEPQGRLVYHSPTWDVELNHISHGNARAGAPDGQWCSAAGPHGMPARAPTSSWPCRWTARSASS